MSNRYDESAGRQEDYGRYGMARDRQDRGRYGQGGEARSWGDDYSELHQQRSQGAYGGLSHGSSNQPSGGGYSGGAAGGYGNFGGHGSQSGQGGYGPLYQGSSYGQDSSSFSRSSGPYDDRESSFYDHPDQGRGGYARGGQNRGRQLGDERYSSFSTGNPQHDPGGGYGYQGGARSHAPFSDQGGYSWDRNAGQGQSRGYSGEGGGTYGQTEYSQAARRSNWRTDNREGVDWGASQASEHHNDPHYRRWRDQQLDSHDRDYSHWRDQQAKRYDDDYKSWRDERHQAFSKDFEGWRSTRGAGGQSVSDLTPGAAAGASAGEAAVEDVTDGGTGRHDDKLKRDEKRDDKP